jgi:hypothetical protein
LRSADRAPVQLNNLKIEIRRDVPEMLSEKDAGAIHGKQMKFSRGGLRRAQHAAAWQWRLAKRVNKQAKGIQEGEFRSFVGRSNIYEKLYIERPLHDKS